MITKMSHVLIWVRDQQEALEFYRDKLGFEVDTDAKIGDDYRWLTMRIKDQPGFEIILMEPKAGMMLDEESAAHLQNVRRAESVRRRIQGTAYRTGLGHCYGDEGQLR